MGCITCKAPRSKATSHHTNVPASLVPGEFSHCGNDQTLYWCSQECSSTSQPRPNSSSYLRPAIIHSSKTDPVEVARHDWLQGSGWTQALVQADITTAGTADSFLRAAHATRTRRANKHLEWYLASRATISPMLSLVRSSLSPTCAAHFRTRVSTW